MPHRRAPQPDELLKEAGPRIGNHRAIPRQPHPARNAFLDRRTKYNRDGLGSVGHRADSRLAYDLDGAHLPNQERKLVQLAERPGLPLAYQTSMDLAAYPAAPMPVGRLPVSMACQGCQRA